MQWNNFVEYCISYAQTNKINDVFEIPTENEQKQNIADVENTPAFFVPQEVIDNDLQGGSGFQDGKFRIYQQFLKGETNIKNADLKTLEGLYSYRSISFPFSSNSINVAYLFSL